MKTRMKAPYKRGTKLIYNGRLGTSVPVKYRKWWGGERSSLIIVQFPNKELRTVHVHEVKPVEQSQTNE